MANQRPPNILACSLTNSRYKRLTISDNNLTALIRAAALQGFDTASHTVGISPLAQLRKVGLPTNCLHEPDSFLPYHAFSRLLVSGPSKKACWCCARRMPKSEHWPIKAVSSDLRQCANRTCGVR